MNRKPTHVSPNDLLAKTVATRALHYLTQDEGLETDAKTLARIQANLEKVIANGVSTYFDDLSEYLSSRLCQEGVLPDAVEIHLAYWLRSRMERA